MLASISTHTSRVGCDADSSRLIAPAEAFLLTHHVWDVTLMPFSTSATFSFLLTHPVWDVTTYNSGDVTTETFLLTHPVWDVTKWHNLQRRWVKISTHTSRVGCDFVITQISANSFISTHTSRVGCDNFML